MSIKSLLTRLEYYCIRFYIVYLVSLSLKNDGQSGYVSTETIGHQKHHTFGKEPAFTNSIKDTINLNPVWSPQSTACSIYASSDFANNYFRSYYPDESLLNSAYGWFNFPRGVTILIQAPPNHGIIMTIEDLKLDPIPKLSDGSFVNFIQVTEIGEEGNKTFPKISGSVFQLDTRPRPPGLIGPRTSKFPSGLIKITIQHQWVSKASSRWEASLERIVFTSYINCTGYVAGVLPCSYAPNWGENQTEIESTVCISRHLFCDKRFNCGDVSSDIINFDEVFFACQKEQVVTQSPFQYRPTIKSYEHDKNVGGKFFLFVICVLLSTIGGKLCSCMKRMDREVWGSGDASDFDDDMTPVADNHNPQLRQIPRQEEQLQPEIPPVVPAIAPIIPVIPPGFPTTYPYPIENLDQSIETHGRSKTKSKPPPTYQECMVEENENPPPYASLNV